jgi:hypothetical protein
VDFVWVCRRGDNEELRYSIRSVLASFPDANIWVVGGKPDWYGGNFIKTNRIPNKYDQVESNLQSLVNSKHISETFVLMNDDFFIVKPVSTIEYFHRGLLLSAYEDLVKHLGQADLYAKKLWKMLKGINNELNIKDPLSYELHVPMVMEKSKLSTLLGKKYPMWRSFYGNKYSVGGSPMADVKVYSHNANSYRSVDHLTNESSFLSTDDESFKVLQPYLQELFPNPSRYELDKQ